jgi:hypothetical protein
VHSIIRLMAGMGHLQAGAGVLRVVLECYYSAPHGVLLLPQDYQTPIDVACSGGAGLAALRGEMEVLLVVGISVSSRLSFFACQPACVPASGC